MVLLHSTNCITRNDRLLSVILTIVISKYPMGESGTTLEICLINLNYPIIISSLNVTYLLHYFIWHQGFFEILGT
ncbi:hypothetical protein XELAEV_18043512mg [Xenopus laevis]|uniref:Uncharacterized protein n=1 Tax=Xenopus laevis TaxID=8355 RepID=A0A974H2H5_XENLA|nr:hypothetical protein XELAEV_18043512mg [Xenopus laevis]